MAATVRERVRFRFLHSAASDLTWYIGSSLAGWLYVALILVLGEGLADPVRDPFARLTLLGVSLPLTLGLLVVGSWAILIDAPHVFATLARTWLDPDEWRERRSVLVGSTAWFLLGPALILGPYVLGSVVPLAPATMALPSYLFFVFFRLWAYYHVVRQHWGFLVLYKRRNDDFQDPVENRADTWFFNAALYLPLLLFLTAPWYAQTGMPELGLSRPVLAGYSTASLLHPALLAAYPAVILSYAAFQVVRYKQGRPRNGPKLLLLLAVVPLHLAVFLHPLLALFLVPVVTVGHNLQYHRIVWVYGRTKYPAKNEASFRWARSTFRSVPSYLGLGLLFTLLLYQGPFVELVKSALAGAVDGIGFVAGIAPPEGASIGPRVAASLFLGWAMQHYYLDSKIWRVRRDPKLQALLERPSVP
ncbi:MAG TPA: hypothetical protein VJ921_08360 [Vicinamibacteria bacterium]|nr:hypothetical protein [Vicinamibacteria bacterium]